MKLSNSTIKTTQKSNTNHIIKNTKKAKIQDMRGSRMIPVSYKR